MPREADIQDELITDALAYGGPEFAEAVQDEANAAADLTAPWDGTGDEPVERTSVWMATLWQLVDQRRAELVGQLVPTSDGRVRQVTPARCPAGHPFDHANGRLAGWQPCRCGGHRTWCCQIPLADGTRCELEILFPDVGEDCHFAGIG